MAFSLIQLQALDNAIASGVLTIEYEGRKKSYRSMDDLIKARNLVRSELAALGLLPVLPGSNRGPATLAVFRRD